jgi:aminoglycoside phosphotransferase (APT) family kinase protein
VEQLGSLEPRRVATIGQRAIETMARLHAVDADAVGLADFGRADGYLARQVRRWGRQLEDSTTRDLPGASQLRQALADSMPSDSALGIVHGDYRLDNLLIDDDDRVVAVLDWEMATLGDPVMDLALMIAYDRLARHPDGAGIANASTADGFPTATEVIELYTRASGRDVPQIGFYLALAFFKLAMILEGIHDRHLHGKTVGEGFGRAGGLVVPAIQAGLESIGENH